MSDIENTPEADDDVPAFDTPDVVETEAPAAAYARELVPDRGIKESTRKLFAEAAAKVRAQLEEPDEDELVPATTVPPAAPGGSTAAPMAPPVAVTTPPPPGAAPVLDDAAKAAAERASAASAAREQALAERETKLQAREAEIATKENLAARYADAPGATLVDLIKQWTGVADGDELRDELADVITELSAAGLGVPMPDAHKTRVESKKAVRTVKQYKAELARKESDAQAKEAAAKQEQAERAAIADVGRELAAAKDKFPYLMTRGNADAIVWDVIRVQYDRDPKYKATGTAPNWEECARIAEEHFRKQDDAWFAERRHLLAPAAPQAPAPTAATPQGDPQSHRSSTLTNRATAPVAPSTTPANGGDEPYDRDAARSRSLAKLRQAVKERTT